LIIDEIAEAINEQVIQILNKGRGAGFKAFVAFQAWADLEAKLRNAAKMLQVLGNLNHQIYDWKTATPQHRDAAKTVPFVT
jgi:conjugal transfer pilus assembly protein TraD